MFQNCWGLVVEDDAHSLIAISGMLKDLGIRYKRNTTGASVIQQAQSMLPELDFILMDLDLPEADPFFIHHALKSHTALARIPVIAIAGDHVAHLMPQVRAASFDGFLTKPLPRRRFGELLGRVLAGEQIWHASV